MNFRQSTMLLFRSRGQKLQVRQVDWLLYNLQHRESDKSLLAIVTFFPRIKRKRQQLMLLGNTAQLFPIKILFMMMNFQITQKIPTYSGSNQKPLK